ncbi:MAG: hypothetical protein AAF660_01190 [Pseudomonadota bacterium]
MKIAIPRIGMMLKLSTAATVLAMSQVAMADGTDAGTPINNTATVNYQVGGNDQTPIDAIAPTFVVDRIVTFTIAPEDGVNAVVAPNEQDAVTRFVITNTGNSPIDLRLSAINLTGATVNGTVDDADMETDFVFLADNSGNGILGDGTDSGFVDALAEGANVVVGVLADAPISLIDGQFAHIELTATAADPGTGINPAPDGALGADLLASGSDDASTIDVVFNDGGNDGFEASQDGYEVQAATLAITKTATVIEDPINGTLDPFAIPGAIVEYAIVITNTGGASATNISIGDVLTAELLFETANLPSGSGNVSITENGTTTYCTADAGDANTDGCTFDGTDTLTIEGSDSSGGTIVPITVGTDPVTIRFRAQIDPS